MHLPEFEALGLAPLCIAALAHEGYVTPTPIQAASIPALLQGKDLLGCAQTGTGKTAAFALPTIQYLINSGTKREKRRARTLVVAPTRELAMQIDASFAAYGRNAGLKRACVYGGVGKIPQIKALERGVDVLVATPGRLLDLQGEGYIDLSAVEIAVLDEADRMLDMGFIHDVKRIMALLPKQRQTLLFSATMPEEIQDLAHSFLRDPVRVDIDPEQPAVEKIEQTLYYVEKGAKRDLLAYLIKELPVTRAVVFSKTKHGADRIAKSLHAAGIEAGVIHANKGQGNRTKTMEAFKAGLTPILVATDIAARGIDVDDITHVFNFDQPTEPETYVHRIGRTARAGASGKAISFCDTEEKKFLRQVERLLGKPIPVVREHPYTRPGSGSHDDHEDERRGPRQFRGLNDPRHVRGGARRGDQRSGEQRTGGQKPGEPGRQGQPSRGPSAQGRGPSSQGRGQPSSSSRPPRGQKRPAQGSSRGEAQAERPQAPRPQQPRPRSGEYSRDEKLHKDVRSAIDQITGRSSG
jgi:ATP-dependent RNA helicase RhlE